MKKCPYCRFEADTEEEVDNHIEYLQMTGDMEHLRILIRWRF